MPRERSVDIDEPIDFLYAEFLIEKELAKINKPE
jgi:CMP-N-acetylneuraminic acid synthetase